MDWKLDTIIQNQGKMETMIEEIKNHTVHEEGDYMNDYLILGVKSDNTLTKMLQSIAFSVRSLRMVCMGDG